MKAQKVCNIFVVIFFLVAITIPLIAVNKASGKVSTAENRVLASFPNFTTSDGKINTGFIKEFETWFSDNLGLRDEFVMANTKIQYDVFGKLTRSNTVKGKNNWLYLMYPNMVQSYQNLDLPTQDKYLQYSSLFNQLHNYFENINTPFITMVNPDKETVYPENMPDTILKVGNVSKTNQAIDYLINNTEVDIFSTENSLLKAKQSATVYSQNYDLSHWNQYGAFIGYLDLMDHVKMYIPDIKILSWDDFTVEPYKRTSKLMKILPFEETDYHISYNNEYTAIEERGPLDNFQLISSHLAFRYVNNNVPNAPKALIMGDSYIYMFILHYLSESFSELTFIHKDNMGKIKSFVDVLNPDIFILEFMEPAVHHFVDTVTYPEGYFDIYSRFKNVSIVPKPENGLMWLDYVNDTAVPSNNTITIDKTDQVIRLEGWAVDPNVGNVADSIFLKVGDKYYSGEYGIPRATVSDYFQNANYTNSGFTFNINPSDLIKAGKFSFIIISKDKSYQYEPVDYKVEVK